MIALVRIMKETIRTDKNGKNSVVRQRKDYTFHFIPSCFGQNGQDGTKL